MPEFTTVTRVPVLTGATVDEFAAIGAAVPARASPGPATPTAAGKRSGIAGSNAPCSTYAMQASNEISRRVPCWLLQRHPYNRPSRYPVTMRLRFFCTRNSSRDDRQNGFGYATGRVKMIIETKDDVRESDLINATLWKYLDKITTKDVLEFREEFG
ncbi:hypothetical protein KZ874_33625, partial [Pseudomonas aeruginosa]|uniref:hypothetical protein n=1 Tax=Pseudomonas aeruginosa TaxID=287 RepID=UPI001CA47F0C